VRLLIALGIVVLTSLPISTPAHAETVVYDEGADTGIPKGVVGFDGVKCTGESTVGDVTYRNTIYIGADAGWMDTQPSRERAWQKDHCRYMEELQHGWFWDKRGIAHPAVKITVEQV
jgi:hypothetical protein